MILSILNRTKKLLGITGNDKDELLLLLIDCAIAQIQEYIHSDNVGGLEPIIALLVSHNYQTGEGTGQGGSSGGGVDPVLGEVKSESFYDVTYTYTTTADFAGKSSSSGSSSSGSEPDTYFTNMIAPYLKGRRHIQTLQRPYGMVADDDLYR